MIVIPPGYKMCKGGPYNGQLIAVESESFESLTFTAKNLTGRYSSRVSPNTPYMSESDDYVYWWRMDNLIDLTIYL